MSVSADVFAHLVACDRCVRKSHVSVRVECLDLCPSCANRFAMEVLEVAEKAAKMDDFNDGDLRSTGDWFAGTR